ncbi:MAG: ABC transporter permease [candidate division KSB1 bacterium]|nr:ABC transporter permease [candidate division KSB1 bacterium]MDZ7364844.1 ABC transporter permease [candidate division KSB1 bacterium]MDZ7402947.1 ABC transporter permease [candidate division KSB1 bacterium]
MTLSKAFVARFFSDYGMLGVLVVLCLYFSWATLQEQHPEGEAAAALVAENISSALAPKSNILVVAKATPQDFEFAEGVRSRLQAAGFNIVAVVTGDPAAVRQSFQALADSGVKVDAIAATKDRLYTIDNIKSGFAALSAANVVIAGSYQWPTFLLHENLINVVNQIAVIAIIAIGMTMVIITGGIDLSVGSVVALAAVVAASLIVQLGGAQAGTWAMLGACAVAILVCGLMGMMSGVMITRFSIPPFIATLGWMLVASGLAYIIARGESIYDIPNAFAWLGRGADIFSIPNAVVLMLLLYLAAHFLMSQTALGRHIYAVGGNAEAARLAGVRVQWILLFVYTVSGLMAGLGGIILASQLKSGAPTYGLLYELYVIAAVVVGGASLSGGEGKIFGTLIGALLIGVIQNGMNLTGVESYAQKVVLGLVILGAVLLDKLRR